MEKNGGWIHTLTLVMREAEAGWCRVQGQPMLYSEDYSIYHIVRTLISKNEKQGEEERKKEAKVREKRWSLGPGSLNYKPSSFSWVLGRESLAFLSISPLIFLFDLGQFRIWFLQPLSFMFVCLFVVLPPLSTTTDIGNLYHFYWNAEILLSLEFFRPLAWKWGFSFKK